MTNINNDIPLTEEQAAFAAEHEALIGQYLRIRRLPKDEYYDVVVFGYLRAVRRSLTLPRLQEYSLRTIAFRAMGCDLFNHWRALRTQKRTATVLEYDADRHASGLEDTVAMELERREDYQETCRRVRACITPKQGEIIDLKARGFSDYAAAKEGGYRRPEVKAELEAVRDNIMRFAPELMERAA